MRQLLGIRRFGFELRFGFVVRNDMMLGNERRVGRCLVLGGYNVGVVLFNRKFGGSLWCF